MGKGPKGDVITDNSSKEQREAQDKRIENQQRTQPDDHSSTRGPHDGEAGMGGVGGNRLQDSLDRAGNTNSHPVTPAAEAVEQGNKDVAGPSQTPAE